MVGEKAESGSQVSTLAQLAWIQSSAVWMKGLIMCAGPLTVPFRWEQQLLGVAAHWGHHLLPFTITVRHSVGGTDSDWLSLTVLLFLFLSDCILCEITFK